MISTSIIAQLLGIVVLVPLVTALQSVTYSPNNYNRLFLSTSRISACSPGQDNKNAEKSDFSRRRLLEIGLMASLSVKLLTPVQVGAVYNPLNLKGSFWETGELYQQKENEIPLDPDELLASVKQAEAALDSLSNLVLEGELDLLSKKLRGGAVSESQLRLRANALIDMIEDDEKMYVASELFRNFLREFDLLDRAAEAAVRQSKFDGGVVETLGLAVVAPIGAANKVIRMSSEPNLGKDARIDLLVVLGTATKTLHGFNSAVEEALGK
uniref:Uncharacterized protein n=1 Tax=Fibrocapsa japonica TaxID=94617 RepID=A0A7S2V6L3_9STRA|mmetsp:Transcript_9709/g.14922  ORF Transcript_9709/g.14922 Transcript_9709/m.14922 type:complete len:269 (+) Transcript_9709:95-901(+)|eukprot:CAMPEP_0113947458 /NCGR_PEP_ID=MMETSP1339-20121228/64934_1 /TAXON_ID=94617 /ORGANISM="Fibrocapsa japonica" /LENGTH=268 /DNA_ID=CAMNT_0000954079 /DNA_START=24 /DNA_END=830 /DNA_ORIENTATION=+ /assembly_acc=CAM_ASM_000762